METPPYYLASPKSGSGPGVLVLHAWWGLNPFFKRVCDRLANAGFVALAPDLYDGKIASTEAAAKDLRARATASRREPAYKMLTSAIGHLSRLESVASPRIAVVGFSMGGHWALWLAQRPELPIDATVVFYAARNGDFRQSGSRFLFHFAEVDDWVSAASIRKLKRSMELAGKDASYHVYPGTTHWFFESDRPQAFNKKAAAASWKRSLEFLRATAVPCGRRALGPKSGTA
ncbi:MAG: dienelactone hydrolase family protein [Burkholderiaceae bacterium]|nr:dienelactone hydrolase family protein [Burkholderiaceae bacterium]